LASPTIPGKPSIVGITGPIHDQSANRTFRPGRLSPIGELTLENDRVTLFSLLPMLGSMLLKSLPSWDDVDELSQAAFRILLSFFVEKHPQRKMFQNIPSREF